MEHKKIAVVPWQDEFLNDDLFDLNSPRNRDGSHVVWQDVRRLLLSEGWEIHTIDLYPSIKEVDRFLFFCFNKKWYDLIKRSKLEDRTIYAAFEPPVVDSNHSDVGLRSLLQWFKYIITWNDDPVDDQRIFKFMYPYDFTPVPAAGRGDRKLLVNMSGNKTSAHKDELYSERKRLIEYFDGTGQFDLYGPGWEKEGYQCYRGIADCKKNVYPNYKFALSLENMKNIRGYVTEKILDCFCCGIVPIYAGASNIESYIPADCFIHYDAFHSYDELYRYLTEMPEAEYEHYLAAAGAYLAGSQREIFSPASFVSVLMRLIEKNDPFILRAGNQWWFFRSVEYISQFAARAGRKVRRILSEAIQKLQRHSERT